VRLVQAARGERELDVPVGRRVDAKLLERHGVPAAKAFQYF
jgi:hypothetical protein